MELTDFDYILPPERIAQTAVEPRDTSRLLVIHKHKRDLEHRTFHDLTGYLNSGDVLVLNRTRVIPARLAATKIPSGGSVEILLLQKQSDCRWLAMVGGRNLRVGSRLAVKNAPFDLTAQIIEIGEESRRIVEFSAPVDNILDQIGELPLPPYIHTPLADKERYQTVYAEIPGSVAAPTAGLHFTPALLEQIQQKGVQIVYCTLHVGLGTFLPVRADQIENHRLHSEYAELSPDSANVINVAKQVGGRIIAVGTTSVRTLETAAMKSEKTGEVVPIQTSTDLFIMPGFEFRIVDAMITNFHLPKSTLLVLVSAFAGRETILNAYQVAIQEQYRFYSLGDACLIVE